MACGDWAGRGENGEGQGLPGPEVSRAGEARASRGVATSGSSEGAWLRGRGEVGARLHGGGGAHASGRWRYVCCGGRCAERRRRPRSRGCECRFPLPRRFAGLSPRAGSGFPGSWREPRSSARLPCVGSTSVCQGRRRPARVALRLVPPCGRALDWTRRMGTDLSAPENKTSLPQKWKP